MGYIRPFPMAVGNAPKPRSIRSADYEKTQKKTSKREEAQSQVLIQVASLHKRCICICPSQHLPVTEDG